jgi:hypothetical protein
MNTVSKLGAILGLLVAAWPVTQTCAQQGTKNVQFTLELRSCAQAPARS